MSGSGLLCVVGREAVGRSVLAPISAVSIAVVAVFGVAAKAPPAGPIAQRIVVGSPTAVSERPPPATRHGDGTPEPRPRPARTALLVGLDNAPGGSPLPGSRADVHTMRRALLMYGFDPGAIVTLVEGQATRAAIHAALDQIAARTSDDSITVVLFAAHSSWTSGGLNMRVWDGRIGADDFATRLARVRGRVWTTFATCFAGGYARPGVIGSRRIAVFSSSASKTSLQLGDAGSFLVLYLARHAMIEGRSPRSVESAFRYAREHIALADVRHVPRIDDRIPGELVLGRRPSITDDERPRGVTRAAPTPRPTHAPTEDPLVRRLVRFPQTALVPAPLMCSPANGACRGGPSAR